MKTKTLSMNNVSSLSKSDSTNLGFTRASFPGARSALDAGESFLFKEKKGKDNNFKSHKSIKGKSLSSLDGGRPLLEKNPKDDIRSMLFLRQRAINKKTIENVIDLYEEDSHLTIQEACQNLGISYVSFIRKVDVSGKHRYYQARALRSRLLRKHKGSSYIVQFSVKEEDLEELSAMDRFEKISDAAIMRSLIKEAIIEEKDKLGIVG